MEILDNLDALRQKDPSGALKIIADQYQQTLFDAKVWSEEHDSREITGIVVVGMGGSALAADIAKVWLRRDLQIPFEVVRGYDLPSYVGRNTLVIASSYSGNTEETISALENAEHVQAQLAIIASGGKLMDIATGYDVAHVNLPDGISPRMSVICNLRAILAILENFDVIYNSQLDEIEKLSGWLGRESSKWSQDVPMQDNFAKQLAKEAVGKTAVFYGGELTAPVAYKWKISWNENSKNTAFSSAYPEANHNEFIGWTSHPVEKPFAVFDIVSQLENPRVLKRFDLSNKMLSGKRPNARTINLEGESLIAQLLWGSILADFVSVYLAILNGVDSVPVELIERFKKELKD